MPTPTENAVALTGKSLIDGLTQGGRWDFGGGPRVLTYSFSLNDTANGGAWSARLDMMNQVRVALDAWASVANISFTEFGSGGVFLTSAADMAITLTGNRMFNAFGAVGLSVFPSSTFAVSFRQDMGYDTTQYPNPAGDVFFDNSYPDYVSVSTGRLGFYYLLHETGHALGLKHPSDDGFNGRPTFAQLGLSSLDSTTFTIMSNNFSLGVGNTTSFNPTTPMILDIQAIQQIYGANMGYHTGDDVYVLDLVTKSIWDAGGFDVLDASSSDRAVEVDLRPGSISTPAGSVSYTGIAFGVVLEKAVGSAFNDTIRGSDSSDIIDGGAGADFMEGRGGDDQYLVDNGADTIIEATGGGADSVTSSVTYTLSSNVESLTLTGASSINGTANAGNNTLTGNGADNVLTGGAGDDLYVVQNAGDTVVEGANEGADRVESSVSFALSANVENITLTGAGDINATGNALGNRLVGNSGINTLTGGDGDDVYIVQNAGDAVVEAAAQGRDRIETPFTTTLAVNFEDLTLTGTDDVSGTGNASDNVLLGNSGINVLTGGLGDDTYGVDNAADAVLENAGEGSDTVIASLSYTLASTLEHLSLTGAGNLNGVGNAANNTLTGNRGDNVLTSGGGSDTFFGGPGLDTSVLPGNKSDYTMSYAGGRITLTSTTSMMTLTGVESVQYGNGVTQVVATLYLEATRDADGDGRADIYWRNTEDGRVSAWLMDGLTVKQGEVFSNVPLEWQVQDTLDLDGDGKSDLLWRNVNDGRVSTWLMDGLTVKQGEVFGNVPLEWKVQGTSDFNGDGKSDILWRNVNDGRVSAWLMNGLTVVQGEVFSNVPLEWQIQKTGDFNGDGSGDILWRNVNDGRVSAWLMNGLVVKEGSVFSDVPLEWKVQETGDLDADGHTDILWRNTSTGQVSAWLMDGLQVKQGAVFSDVPLEWQVRGMGDFNNDLHTDILWRHTDGTVSQWLMDGLTVLQGSVFQSVPTAWGIVG